MRKQTVLVSGGGVPGLTLAHALARLPLDVTLVEPHPPIAPDDQPDGRTVAIMVKHIDWMDALGVWKGMGAISAPLRTMRIVDNSVPNRPAARPHDFRAAMIGQDAFARNIPLRALRHHLWASLPATIRIAAEKPDGDFDLIVAADGRQSPTREAAGIAVAQHDTGQSALTFVVRRTAPHGGVSTEYQRVDGPLTLVPLPDPNLCSTVFVGTTDDQTALRDAGPDAVAAAMLDITGENMSVISVMDLFPLSFLQADRLWRDNVVLTAEAAHVLHPLGAQGMNLSLQDMKSLGDLVEKALQNGLPISDAHAVMTAYHKARHADHLARARAVRTSLDFLRHGAVTGGVRRGVLELLDRLPLVEKTLLKIAQ